MWVMTDTVTTAGTAITVPITDMEANMEAKVVVIGRTHARTNMVQEPACSKSA